MLVGSYSLFAGSANSANSVAEEENSDADLMKSVKTLFGKKNLVPGKFEFIDLNPKDVAEVNDEGRGEGKRGE